MLQALKRNGTLLVGMVLSGAVCAKATPFLLSDRGALGPTALQSVSPVKAIVALVGVTVVATAIAIVVGRVINSVVGLFVLGVGMFVLAMRLANVVELSFAQGSLVLVAVETVLMSALVLGAVIATFRFAGPMRDVPEDEGSPWAGDHHSYPGVQW